MTIGTIENSDGLGNIVGNGKHWLAAVDAFDAFVCLVVFFGKNRVNVVGCLS